jgi:hypothetical protein
VPSLIRRFNSAIAAGRRAVTEAAPLAPAGLSPAVHPNAEVPDPITPAWALVHFGDARALDSLIEAHRATCAARGFRCLLLSDDLPPVCVGSREILFEFVPWPAATALTVPGGFSAAVDHSFIRLSQTLTFWYVIGCDWEGDKAKDFVSLAPDWVHPVIRASRRDRRHFSNP